MAKPRFYDKMGAPIEKARWQELTADPLYREVMVYDNQRVLVKLIWVGKVADPAMMDAEYWPLFRLDIFDNTGDGATSWTPAMETGETFGSVEAGKKAYQDHLIRWTGSKMEEDHKGVVRFEEVDNIASPPPKPDDDAPMSKVEIGTDGSGVW